MRVVIDIEANGLVNPTKIWVIVCKDIDTEEVHVFRNVTDDRNELASYLDFASSIDYLVGHNIVEYDVPVQAALIPELRPKLEQLLELGKVHDTLILSRLVDYSREGGHSLERWGQELGIPKGILINGELIENKHIPPSFFAKYSTDLENYCINDVEIAFLLHKQFGKCLRNQKYARQIRLSHDFQLNVNDINSNGFQFDTRKALVLLEKVTDQLTSLDKEILDAFPPREILIREFTPKLTKHGTISRSSVPRQLHGNIHNYEAGTTYRHTKQEPFNPASHKQLIDVLTEARWRPIDKTKTHIDTERTLNQLKRLRNRDPAVDLEIQMCHTSLEKMKKYGWKINETNLSTLPVSAPSPARLLAKRILLEARRRTLTEWLGLVQPDGRIHGRVIGIGTWTHRTASQKPNMQNIPNEFNDSGVRKLLGKELRSLWCAPKGRLLAGVDAEGIQLRIFAHYIDDKEFTQALVSGKKHDKSDPHSLNQRILGSICKTRQAAKRFIFALLLGAGVGKLAEILGSSEDDAREALNRLMARYQGFTYLKENVIPADARRGYFNNLLGWPVKIPGDTEGMRRHLCMSGYLQNGEALVMQLASVKWNKELRLDEELKEAYKFVNLIHDEFQTEVPNDMSKALKIVKVQAQSITWAGEQLGLLCPLSGSYYNDDIKDYTIGTNWAQTH